MVEDRFEEEETKSITQQTREAYEDYLEHFDYEEGTPMNWEDFKDYWWRY